MSDFNKFAKNPFQARLFLEAFP